MQVDYALLQRLGLPVGYDVNALLPGAKDEELQPGFPPAPQDQPGTDYPLEHGMVPDTVSQLQGRGEEDTIPGTNVPRTNPVPQPAVSPASPLGRTFPWLTRGELPPKVEGKPQEPAQVSFENFPIQQTGNVESLKVPEGTASWTPAAPGQSAAEVASGVRPRVSPETQAVQDAASVDVRLQAQKERNARAQEEARQAAQKAKQDQQTAFVKPIQDILSRAKIDATSNDPSTRAQGEAAIVKLSPVLQGILTQAGMAERMTSGGGGAGRETFTTDATGKIHSTLAPSERPATPTVPNADEILAEGLGFNLKARRRADGTPMTQADFLALDKEKEASATRVAGARALGGALGKADPRALSAAQSYADAIKKGQAQTIPPEHVATLAEAFLTPASPMYGKMPNMGFGAAGMPARLQLLGAISEKMKEPGFTAMDTATRNALMKGYQSELTSQQGQRGKIDPFIRTTNANLDQAMALFPKIGNGGVPVINKWVNRYKAEFRGDPDVAALNAVIDSAMAEYSKVVTSATGSGVTAQAERDKWESRLNSSFTDAQAIEVVKNLKQELNNRLTSYDESMARITQDIRNLGGTSVGSPPPPPPAQGGGLPTEPPPNPGTPRNIKWRGTPFYWDGKNWGKAR
jgi:hypothetical protein